MFNYRKRLFYPVHVDGPDPEFARILLDHYGGRYGKFTMAAQYLNHRSHMMNRYVRELLGVIASEELSHLEMLGAAISKLGGTTLTYVNSKGNAWKTAYLKEGLDPLELIQADIDTELSSQSLYRKHISMTKDPGLIKMLDFLITREEVHQHLFQKAKLLLQQESPQEEFNQLIYEYRMSLQVLE